MTIREMVEHSGLTQKAFAEIYKIYPRTLELWLSGKKLPRGNHTFYLLERCVRYDVENERFPVLAAERQIEAMERARTEEDITNNRFM